MMEGFKDEVKKPVFTEREDISIYGSRRIQGS